MDLAFIALTLGFFAASWWLVRACESMEESKWTASTSSACWWRSPWPSTCSWLCWSRSAS